MEIEKITYEVGTTEPKSTYYVEVPLGGVAEIKNNTDGDMTIKKIIFKANLTSQVD